MKKKTILSVLLTLAMLASLLPAAALPALAAGPKNASSWTSLANALQAGGSITLTADVAYQIGVDTQLLVPEDVEATLDLNGHVINAEHFDTAITVRGALSLTDVSMNGGGVITGADTGIYVDGGSVTMERVTITGNGGRGVRVEGWTGAAGEPNVIGSFTMNSGSIIGNGSAPDPEQHFPFGGGVVVMGETAGTVDLDISPDDSGVVYTALFTMNGGLIQAADPDELADSASAGVTVMGGRFTMNGGAVTDSATGVCVGIREDYCFEPFDELEMTISNFRMLGGTISDCETAVWAEGHQNSLSISVMDGEDALITDNICGVQLWGETDPDGGSTLMFHMIDGSISDNADYSEEDPNGSNVFVTGGVFQMDGGTISGSEYGIFADSWHYPDGKYPDHRTVVSMNGGEIASALKNGVCIYGDCDDVRADSNGYFSTLLLNDGVIRDCGDYGVSNVGALIIMGSGNDAPEIIENGGGVFIRGWSAHETKNLTAVVSGFYMYSGTITDNGYGDGEPGFGAGVYLCGDPPDVPDMESPAWFVMLGGEISGNSREGVLIESGDFIMHGDGVITDNPAGVVLRGGYYELEKGEVSGNLVGGVVAGAYEDVNWPEDGTPLISDFWMKGGEIAENACSGVWLIGQLTDAEGEPREMRCSFAMTGGEIRDNALAGVDVVGEAGTVGNDEVFASVFRMEGGEIRDNGDDGVLLYEADFTFAGGEIRDNGFSGVDSHGGRVTLAGGALGDNENSDICLKDRKDGTQQRLLIDGALTNDVPLRIALCDLPAEGETTVFTEGLSENGSAEDFDCVNVGYRVVPAADGEAAVEPGGDYTISIDTDLFGGTITPNSYVAEAGDRIELTIEVDKNYYVVGGKPTVTGPDGIQIELDEDNCFIMPCGDVLILARFLRNAPTGSDADVTVKDDAVTAPIFGGSGSSEAPVTVTGGAAVLKTLEDELLGDAAAGETVTVDLTGLGSLQGFTYGAEAGKTLQSRLGDDGRVATWLKDESAGTAAWYGVEQPAGLLPEGSTVNIRWLAGEQAQQQALNAQQRKTLEQIIKENAKAPELLEVSMIAGGKQVGSLNGRTVDVYAATGEGWSADACFAYCLGEDGGLEPVSSGVEDVKLGGAEMRFAKMSLEHFSLYIVSAVPLCARDESCPLSAFTDVDSAAWYHDGVHWALEQGLMVGTGKDRFAPFAATTRAMVVTMLWRLEGEPEAAAESAFEDVAADAWYAKAVAWAAEMAYVQGTSASSFAPNRAITRQELATLLYRYVQAKGLGFTGLWAFELDFPDADQVADWAHEAICWMNMQEIICGRENGTLDPKTGANRAEIATVFSRLVPLLAE